MILIDWYLVGETLTKDFWKNKHKVNHKVLSQKIVISKIVEYFAVTFVMF